jgi:hypothetical protein
MEGITFDIGSIDVLAPENLLEGLPDGGRTGAR